MRWKDMQNGTSARITWLMPINASSTATQKLYTGTPEDRSRIKSPIVAWASQPTCPRTISSISTRLPGGTRKRTAYSSPAATFAATSSSEASRHGLTNACKMHVKKAQRSGAEGGLSGTFQSGGGGGGAGGLNPRAKLGPEDVQSRRSQQGVPVGRGPGKHRTSEMGQCEPEVQFGVSRGSGNTGGQSGTVRMPRWHSWNICGHSSAYQTSMCEGAVRRFLCTACHIDHCYGCLSESGEGGNSNFLPETDFALFLVHTSPRVGLRNTVSRRCCFPPVFVSIFV